MLPEKYYFKLYLFLMSNMYSFIILVPCEIYAFERMLVGFVLFIFTEVNKYVVLLL